MVKKRTSPKFTKEQFLQSHQRSGQEKDILAAVLEDNKAYTIAEADKAIQNYLKRGVK
ncbi:hypothetical protein J40TS1_40310 [Paenibacillus montaniterrae]|uniref:YqzN/YkzM domain-containing protein n=1 Tax=Paenibacillus montaniterrae TaxID=429341 RepID=A0A919YU07_9BACL|nr:hypothetical protein [Paenibacillus montaniterrae]GIP18389.1 hypothetical protein J40TS1_40310 [Paenibacillus montaniterrae]